MRCIPARPSVEKGASEEQRGAEARKQGEKKGGWLTRWIDAVCPQGQAANRDAGGGGAR